MTVKAEASGQVRVDRWLCAARLFKSRSQAQVACSGGHVKLNGVSVRASHVVRAGDWLEVVAPRGKLKVLVKALEAKRQSPARARELYEDHSPPPPPREERVELRPRGTGRPTKADRRSMQRLRGIP
jgi:ribosome-associated heat shock protein Hsp15